ncbi:MAG: peptidylprolyl isomerase [Oscillospiraceae bacterium]|nr:peptidylprolyl isomerase [Oscillospiraceae bacterium]
MKQKKVLLLIVGVLLAAAVAVGLFFGIKALTKASGETPTTEALASGDVPATKPADSTGSPAAPFEASVVIQEDEALREAVTTRADYVAEEIPAEDSRWEQVVAACGDYTMNNRLLQVFYYFQSNDYNNWMTMMSGGVDMEWDQYCVYRSLDDFHQYAAVAAQAAAAGHSASEEEIAQVEEAIENVRTDAEAAGLTPDAYLQQYFGSGVRLMDYESFLRLYIETYSYEMKMYENITWTDDDLLGYYNEHPEDFEGISMDTANINVRHILITPEETELPEDATDEEKAAAEAAARETAKAKAEALLESYMIDPSEENFAALAQENSEDPGSVDNGGLYEDVYPGQMVETFNDWCFDPARQSGDTGIVETDYGFHIMYFVGQTDNYHWKTIAEENYPNSIMDTNIRNAMRETPLNLHCEDIALAALPSQDEAE